MEIVQKDVIAGANPVKVIEATGEIDAGETEIFRLTLALVLSAVVDVPGTRFCVDLSRVDAMTPEAARCLGKFAAATTRLGSETVVIGLPNMTLSRNSPLASLALMESGVDHTFVVLHDETLAIERLSSGRR